MIHSVADERGAKLNRNWTRIIPCASESRYSRLFVRPCRIRLKLWNTKSRRKQTPCRGHRHKKQPISQRLLAILRARQARLASKFEAITRRIFRLETRVLCHANLWALIAQLVMSERERTFPYLCQGHRPYGPRRFRISSPIVYGARRLQSLHQEPIQKCNARAKC